MNELFTLLIILAAIISVLNKLFRDKKKQQTSRRQPIPQQKPKDWVPPWLEPDETELQIPESEKEELEIAEEIEYKRPSLDIHEQKKITSTPTTFAAKKKEPIVHEYTIANHEPSVKPLEVFDIELSSRGELKRGIILAEILGQCRAKRFLRR